ncbi:MAG: hypothetical protein WC881_02565, partial [Elusimicrobiota bacterium]
MPDSNDAPQPSAAAIDPRRMDFGLENLLEDAFSTFKSHFGMLLGAFIVVALIAAVAHKIPAAPLLVMPHMAAGFSFLLLAALRGEQPMKFSDLFKAFSFYVPVLVAGLATGILVTLGVICLVVPGVILGLMWSQTMFILADDMREVAAGRKPASALSGWDAMQRS